MSDVKVEQLSVRYGDLLAVNDVSFELASGKRLAILGSSGCGKSSLLRAIAGLEKLAHGTIRVADRDQAKVPTYRRGIGLMFQDHALFPHLTAAGNVGFGLRMDHWSKQDLKARVCEVLELVGLADRADAQIAELSGGEQQRVALARTLAPNPKVILLDEPLGSLDRILREDLLVTMRTAFDATGATAIFVTHDQAEAFAIGDQIALMRQGRFHQVGTPGQLWSNPVDAWSARFLGLGNLFGGQSAGGQSASGQSAGGQAPVLGLGRTPESEFLLRPDLMELRNTDGVKWSGSQERILLDPATVPREAVARGQAVDAVGGGDESAWPVTLSGTVSGSAFRGGYTVVTVAVELSGQQFSLEVWVMGQAPVPGSEVQVAIPEQALVRFSDR